MQTSNFSVDAKIIIASVLLAGVLIALCVSHSQPPAQAAAHATSSPVPESEPEQPSKTHAKRDLNRTTADDSDRVQSLISDSEIEDKSITYPDAVPAQMPVQMPFEESQKAITAEVDTTRLVTFEQASNLYESQLLDYEWSSQKEANLQQAFNRVQNVNGAYLTNLTCKSSSCRASLSAHIVEPWEVSKLTYMLNQELKGEFSTMSLEISKSPSNSGEIGIDLILFENQHDGHTSSMQPTAPSSFVSVSSQ